MMYVINLEIDQFIFVRNLTLKQSKKEVMLEILRFLLVGGIATLADYLVFYIFNSIILKNINANANIAISTTLGFLTGLFINWLKGLLAVIASNGVRQAFTLGRLFRKTACHGERILCIREEEAAGQLTIAQTAQNPHAEIPFVQKFCPIRHKHAVVRYLQRVDAVLLVEQNVTRIIRFGLTRLGEALAFFKGEKGIVLPWVGFTRVNPHHDDLHVMTVVIVGILP